MALARTKIHDTLVSFKNMESDLKWVIHSQCAAHGTSCGGSISQSVTSGVFKLDKSNVNEFSNNYFNYLDKESRDILSSTLKSLICADGFAWTHKYIDMKVGESYVDQPITGAFYVIYCDDDPDSYGKRRVFISLARLVKRPSPNHYFLKDYYEGRQDRIENALMYMTYKDVKSKGFICD